MSRERATTRVHPYNDDGPTPGGKACHCKGAPLWSPFIHSDFLPDLHYAFHARRATITLILSGPPAFNAACTSAELAWDGLALCRFRMRAISWSRTISHKPSEQSSKQSPSCKLLVNQSTSTSSFSPRQR